jgi:hypothetical protein
MHGFLLAELLFVLAGNLRVLNRNFLFDLENGTIVHPFRLFATL